MNLFLDANILVSVLNKEYPLYTYTSRILSLADDKRYLLTTSAICLAIAYYFAAKKHGEKQAKKKMELLIRHLHIAGCGSDEALLAAQNKKVLDFEDGLEYYTALHANCNCIVTNDVNDFHFSDIEVLDPEKFLKRIFNSK